MERTEFKALLEPLVVALRADFDLPAWTVYFRALEDVPAALLAAAVERSAKSDRFMPKPGELRQYAEDARKALVASVAYLPCAQCEETGWEPVTVDGVTRMRRCGCWRRYQDKIAALGVGHSPLAIPDRTDPEAA